VHAKPGYRPELDGLRGIAVLLVIAGHLLIPGFRGASHVGVTLFFVLSGYLITSILRENGDLVRFYARRAKRLLPALLLWLCVMIAAGVVTPREALPPLLYVANWVQVGGGLALPVAHTWSLATEEQFYLLWPVILIVWRRPVALLVAIIVAGAFLRLAMPDSGLAFFASRFDALAWGSLLGLGLVPRIPRVVVLAAIAVLAGFTVAEPGDYRLYISVGLTAVTMASFVVMTVLVSRPTGLLARPPLMAVGRISYGLYLWHVPFVLVAQRMLYSGSDGYLIPTPGQLDDVVVTLAAVAASFAGAVVSWFVVERWFVRPDPQPRTHAPTGEATLPVPRSGAHGQAGPSGLALAPVPVRVVRAAQGEVGQLQRRWTSRP
jgi:peptidoglycan/LPS O-acetylase OafA/YrhL